MMHRIKRARATAAATDAVPGERMVVLPTERTTRQREAIRVGLEQAGRPLTPAELLTAARAQVPGLGIATVYRSLRWLVAAGRVQAVELPGQAPRYAVAGHGASHQHVHHFHCTGCDRVFPIHACPGSIEQLAPAGFRVERHDLTLHGRCADCAGFAADRPERVAAGGAP